MITRFSRTAAVLVGAVLAALAVALFDATAVAQEAEQLEWSDELEAQTEKSFATVVTTGEITITRIPGTDDFTVTTVDSQTETRHDCGFNRIDVTFEGTGTMAGNPGSYYVTFRGQQEYTYTAEICLRAGPEQSGFSESSASSELAEVTLDGLAVESYFRLEYNLPGAPQKIADRLPSEAEVEQPSTLNPPNSSAEQNTEPSEASEPDDNSATSDSAPPAPDLALDTPVDPVQDASVDSEDVTEDEALNTALAGVVAAALAGALTWAEAAAATRDLFENARLKKETPPAAADLPTQELIPDTDAKLGPTGWFPTDEASSDQPTPTDGAAPAGDTDAALDPLGWFPTHEASSDQPAPAAGAAPTGDPSLESAPLGWIVPDAQAGDGLGASHGSEPPGSAGEPRRPGWLPPDEAVDGSETLASDSMPAGDAEAASPPPGPEIEASTATAPDREGATDEAATIPSEEPPDAPAVETARGPDGSVIRTITHPDGSTIVETTDLHGKLTVETSRQDGFMSVTDVDPETNQAVTTTLHPDGRTTVQHTSADGFSEAITRSVEPDGTAQTETVYERADGSTTTVRTAKNEHPDGTVIEATEYNDGTVIQSVVEPDGTETEGRISPDGSLSTGTKHPDGTFTSSETTPDGVQTELVRDPDGVTTSRTTDPNGAVVESVTRPDGTASTTVTASDGTTRSSDSSTKFDPDGSRVTHTTNSDGTSSITVDDPDGSTETTTTHTDGSTTTHTTSGHLSATKTETVFDPDGTTTSRSVHPDGTESTRTVEPDGTVLESSTGPAGTSDSITHPDGSATTRTTEPDGTITTKSRPAQTDLPRDFSSPAPAPSPSVASDSTGSPTEASAPASSPLTGLLPGFDGDTPPTSAPLSDGVTPAEGATVTPKSPEPDTPAAPTSPEPDTPAAPTPPEPEATGQPDLDGDAAPGPATAGAGPGVSAQEVDDIYRRGLASGRALTDLEQDVSGLSQARGGAGTGQNPFGLVMRDTGAGPAPMTGGELDDYLDQRAEVERLREIRDNQDDAWAQLQDRRTSASQPELTEEMRSLQRSIGVWDASSTHQSDLNEAAAWVRTHNNWRLGDTSYKSPTGQTWHQAAISPEENERLLQAQTGVRQMLLDRQRNAIEDVLNAEHDAAVELDDLQEQLLVHRRALSEMLDNAQESVDTYESWASGSRPLPER